MSGARIEFSGERIEFSGDEWRDTGCLEINRLPMRTDFFAFERRQAAREGRRERSRRFQSLNGTWKFRYVTDVRALRREWLERACDTSDWDDIAVPGNWQLHGYGYPVYINKGYDFFDYNNATAPTWLPGFGFDEYPAPRLPAHVNQVGTYRRTWRVSPAWRGMRVVAHIGGCRSAHYLWINGVAVGYGLDSKLPSEYDISGYIDWNAEAQDIVLQVYHWSIGAYMEDQDCWRLSGIEREVYLYATPRCFTRDVVVDAGLTNGYRDGTLRVKLACANAKTEAEAGTSEARSKASETGAARIEASAKLVRVGAYGDGANNDADDSDRDAGDRPLANFQGEITVAAGAEGDIVFTAKIPNAHAWSAEEPNMYALQIVVRHDENEEHICVPCGFRATEIKEGRLCVNGRPIMIRGVNRHEFDPQHGFVATRAIMERDIALLKRNNINAVRASHYPNHSYWYELCDRHGLYVVDEANVETHGMGYSEHSLSHHPEFHRHHIDRAVRMVSRDRNHPSIIIWSLGNESGGGENFAHSYRRVRAQDDSRPIQYEGVGYSDNSDIYCPMYLPPHLIEKHARGEAYSYRADTITHAVPAGVRAKPLILCEYAHAMGNSLGNLRQYFSLFRNHDSLQGGFVWDWVDQGFHLRAPDGTRYYGYGGDFGPAALPNPFTDFCCDGLVTADREPYPYLSELKYWYQPFGVRLHALAPLAIALSNDHGFADSSAYYMRWEIQRDGHSLAKGRVDAIACPAGETVVLPLDCALERSSIEACEIATHLMVTLCHARESALIPRDHVIASEQLELATGSHPAKELIHRMIAAQSEANAGTEAPTRVNTETPARADSILRAIIESIKPNFWIPPNDNDYGNQFSARARPLWKCYDAMRVEYEPAAILYTHRDLGFSMRIAYRPIGARSLLFDCQFSLEKSATADEVGCIGCLFRLGRHLDTMRWYGRGPHETYCDRKQGARIGIYQERISEQRMPYVRPQEFGNHCDCYWTSFEDSEGGGVRIDAAQPLQIQATRYAMEEFDHEARKGQLHSIDAEAGRADFITVRINYLQRGVGGNDSWGAEPLDRYRIMLPQRGSFCFALTLLGEDGGSLTERGGST